MLGRAALAVLESTGRLGERTEAALSPGLTGFVLARHRFMDDALLAALQAGAEQVILLGAGYDTRVWRLHEALRDIPVFEVDHPATGARKAALAAAGSDPLPTAHPIRVAMDFRTDRLDQRLLAAGARRGARTFVVWEGVSMYLTRAAVHDTLVLLRDLGGPGSEVVMDWWSLVDGPDVLSTVHRMAPLMLHLLGEPLTLGIHPEEVPGFCARAGWRAAEVVDAAELERRYAKESRRVLPEMYVTRLERGPSVRGPRAPGDAERAAVSPLRQR
ncbi:MAG: SAM-dependent methyltransferase [Deltaproteobacteria bacterium]|nr:SAM-dependent methyltransferase [Deltaproteobacteria bacterium]